MQRKPTKQSRAANSDERAFQTWVKEQPCCVCGNEPVIVDHIWGSAKKLYIGVERVHVGHWAVIPLCLECDSIKTNGSRRAFRESCDDPVDFWFNVIIDCFKQTHIAIPPAIITAMYITRGVPDAGCLENR